MRMLDSLAERPVIAAVRHQPDLPEALVSPVTVVFLLSATVFNLAEAVDRVRQAGKMVLVHFDMVQGIAKDAYGMQFVTQQAHPDGVITTRANLVTEARSHGLLVVQRTFLLDSQSAHTGIDMVKDARPDVLEILPGIIPSEIQEMVRKINIPVIAGGLVKSKAQCYAALRAGAVGVSTSRKELWNADLRR